MIIDNDDDQRTILQYPPHDIIPSHIMVATLESSRCRLIEWRLRTRDSLVIQFSRD